MLYIITILIILYLMLKSHGTNNFIKYYGYYYLFEQLNSDVFDNLSEYDYNDDDFDNYLSNNENQYYYNHFDFIFLNKTDEYLTKYFNIN